MEANVARVRERYEGLPTDDLRAIANAPEGQYTPAAQGLARELLAGRREEPSAGAPTEPGARPRKRSELWAAIVAMVGGGHILKAIFHAVRAAEEDPDGFRRVATAIVTDPWTYALVILAGVVVWRRRSGAGG